MTYQQFGILMSVIFLAISYKEDKVFLNTMSSAWVVVAILAGVLGK